MFKKIKNHLKLISIIVIIIPTMFLGMIIPSFNIKNNEYNVNLNISLSDIILEENNEFFRGSREYLTIEKNGSMRLEHYNLWTDISPYPSERSSHSMVYDSTRDQAILFGGYDDEHDNETWIYSYSNNSWTKLNPITRPSSRSSHSMVYDSTHDQIILFGGRYYDFNLERPIVSFNDTWIYSYNNNSWSQLKPINNPTPRFKHSMVYDPTHDQVILFGGIYADYDLNKYVYYNDTWFYTFSNNSWTNVNTITRPSARYSSSMIYDSTHDQIILFGGNERYQSILFGPDTDINDDTWIFNFNDNSWVNMNPSTKPSARDGHSMIYDNKNNLTILFGGWDKNLYDKSDTWVYNYSCNLWTYMNPITHPIARDDHSMIFNSNLNCSFIFGGDVNYENDNSWWMYNYSSNTWTSSTSIPIARSDHLMVYDSTHNQIILFGGIDIDHNHLYDTWIYTCSNNSWTKMKPLNQPSVWMGHSMVYDSTHDQVILFGGIDDAYNRNRDTWIYTYSNNSWMEINPSTHPTARAYHTMIYDSKNDQVILFGGSDNSYNILNDTWIYTYNNNSWENMNSITSPSVGMGHSMVYDSTHDQVILFGGLYRNETWIYKYNNNSWVNMNPITSPSSRSFHSMVYDSTHDQIILFGGEKYIDGSIMDINEVWIYNFNNNWWRMMNPITKPSARDSSSMIYDSLNDQVILYGGPNNWRSYCNKVWRYKINDNYFHKGIFDSEIISFNDYYKISGKIEWIPIDQPIESNLQVQFGFSNTQNEKDFLYTPLYNEFFTFEGISRYIRYRIIFNSNSLNNYTPILNMVNITYSLVSLYDEQLNIPLIVSISVGISIVVGMGIGYIFSMFLNKKRKSNI